jgi:hypothetical protein
MANMAAVNKAIKTRFPNLDIEAVRGGGYVYFVGEDGADKVASIYSHPPVTPTSSMAKWCFENIELSLMVDK